MSVISADQWIVSMLTVNAELQALIGNRVFIDEAPQNTVFPYVVFQFVYGSPVTNNSVDKIMMDEVWLIKAVGEGRNYSTLAPIVSLIESIIHKASGTGVIGAVQEEEFRYSETESGEYYKHLGHYYRIFTQ